MSVASYLPIVVFGALFALYYVWIFKKRAGAKAQAGPAWHKFFEHLGYKYKDLLDAPVEAQVEKAMASYGQAGSNKQYMIRDFHGVQVHWRQKTGQTKSGGWSSSMSWSIALDKPPGIVWQIAEKSLGGTSKAVKEAFSNMSRKWTPAYSQRVTTGDAEIDKRFRVYGENPEAVVELLRTAGLKQRLLDNAEVDLLVSEEGVAFNDPEHKNIHAAMGGTVGMMANAGDVTKYIDLLIPVHDRIAELLVSAAQASR